MSDPAPELSERLGRRIKGRLWELWNTRRDYRELWARQAGYDVRDLEVMFPPEEFVAADCLFLGDIVERVVTEARGDCNCRSEVDIHRCEMHGMTTKLPALARAGVTSCVDCPHKMNAHTLRRKPFTGPVKRNVYFHVWPISDRWRWNADQLKRRWHLFNGRKIVAIAGGPGTDVAGVRAYFEPMGAEFVEVSNDPGLREVATFKPSLEMLETDDPNEMTFICHAKGVTRGARPEIIEWADTLWRLGADYVPLVDRLFEAGHGVVGPFKKTGGFDRKLNANWHYSGAFYWIRHSSLFSRDYEVERFWAGIESFVGRNFTYREGGCIGPINSGQDINCYEPEWWAQHREGIARWERDFAFAHSPLPNPNIILLGKGPSAVEANQFRDWGEFGVMNDAGDLVEGETEFTVALDLPFADMIDRNTRSIVTRQGVYRPETYGGPSWDESPLDYYPAEKVYRSLSHEGEHYRFATTACLALHEAVRRGFRRIWILGCDGGTSYAPGKGTILLSQHFLTNDEKRRHLLRLAKDYGKQGVKVWFWPERPPELQ